MHHVKQLGMAAGVILALVGCGGAIADEDGGTGSANGNGGTTAPGVVSPSACKKPCPNDPDLPAEAVTTCQSGKDPSGAGCDREYVAVLNCAAGKITCGADGKTDGDSASRAVIGACASQLFSFQACVSKGFDGGALRPPG